MKNPEVILFDVDFFGCLNKVWVIGCLTGATKILLDTKLQAEWGKLSICPESLLY